MNGNEQKEINEMKDQQTDDDQIDPYHGMWYTVCKLTAYVEFWIQFNFLFLFTFTGKQDPFPEPEVLDLPDDLQLDDGEAREDEENSEIPFDIDNMKGAPISMQFVCVK